MRWHRVMARMAQSLHEQWFWEHSEGPFPTTFSASPCHCCLVERSNHMEKHILLINPSHCLFSQESLPVTPSCQFAYMIMYGCTHCVLWLPSSERHLRGPKGHSLPSSPESVYGSCSSLKLDFCVSQMFYVLCYSSVIVRCRKRGFWSQHQGIINLDLE